MWKAAGIKIIVSVFGSTDAPTSTGADPVATANTMAAWVKEFDLDGIDVDYEVRIFYALMIESTDFSERTSTPSTQGMARPRHGLLPLRDNFAPSFLKETLFSPMLVCFLHFLIYTFSASHDPLV